MARERDTGTRAEHYGPAEPLTPRMVEFIESRLGGRNLDEDGDLEKRPDFECLRGLLVVEIKTLETDPKGRLENALSPERAKADWPAFFGIWPIESILKNVSNSEEIKTRLLDRLGRAIVSHVKKANDQLKSHAERVDRKNLVRLLLLLNEDHPEYTPDVVAYTIQRELMRRDPNGKPRNEHLDAVIYFSDRHVAAGSVGTLSPVIAILGSGLEENPWKESVVNLVLARWAAWNGAPIVKNDDVSIDSFISAERVPDQMARHELWAIQYRREPYMHKWSDEDLRELWDNTVLFSLLWGHRDTPMKIPMDGYIQVMERFTHLREETAARGLPLDYFEVDPVPRRRKVVDKMPYGPEVAKWLHRILDSWGELDKHSAR